MRFLLFGSRAEGLARPDSDWDLALVDPGLVALLPQPWPFLDPRNALVGDDERARMHHFYSLWRDWSRQCWASLGGDAGVARLLTRARAATSATYPELADDRIDLFLYTPPALHPRVRAIRLTLDNRWSLAELGAAGEPYAVLEYLKRQPAKESDTASWRHTGLA